MRDNWLVRINAVGDFNNTEKRTCFVYLVVECHAERSDIRSLASVGGIKSHGPIE